MVAAAYVGDRRASGRREVMIVIADYEVSAGQPVWIELSTTDPVGGRAFYAGLFGWTFDSYPDPLGGQYTLALSGGVPVAGQRDAARSRGAQGWTPYLASPDVVDTAADVRRLGGEVLEEPVAIPWCGRRLLARDPGGATIGFWQPGSQWQCRLYEAGALWWAELATPDTGTADAFYGDLFGYQHKSFGDGGYLVWMLAGTPYLGRLPAEVAARRAHWAVYLVVPAGSTVEACALRAPRLGGTVVAEPFDHSHGRATVLADPGGAEFTVLEVRKPGG